MPDIDHYSRVYDNFLEPEVCEAYIHYFEETLTYDAERHRKLSVCYNEKGIKTCGQCDCHRTNPFEYERFKYLNEHTIKKLQEIINQYREDCGITNLQWPQKYAFEEPKMKKFKVDLTGTVLTGHGLDPHADAHNFTAAKRFLGILVYLSEEFEEGETFFPLWDVKVKPKIGRALIFPPTWDFMHGGMPPRPPHNIEAKYFIQFHTVYVDEHTKYTYGLDKTDRQDLGNFEHLKR